MIYETIKRLCKRDGISVNRLEKELGVSRGSLCRIDVNKPGIDKLQKIASYFNVSIDYLMIGEDVTKNKIEQMTQIPVLGVVHAGIPITAVENILDYEEISYEMARTGEFFALSVRGDSMEPKLSEGDVVIVKKQSDVESGDIAVVLVNGDDATIKKVMKHDNGGISLIALNPAYSPIYFTDEEINTLPVTILGRAVEYRGKL